MSIVKEFKEFAVKGNVMDMAVGIIVGAAFGKIVSSFVGDVVMPPIGVLLGGVNFTDLAVVLKEAVGETAAVTLNYGKFLQTVIDFLIVAGAVFAAVKTINTLKKKKRRQKSLRKSQSLPKKRCCWPKYAICLRRVTNQLYPSQKVWRHTFFGYHYARYTFALYPPVLFER